jgi:hypothetical protein
LLDEGFNSLGQNGGASSTITGEPQERNSAGMLLLMRGESSAKDYSNAQNAER